VLFLTRCLFASDLHGRLDRYEKLLAAAAAERPAAVLLGGDLLPPLALHRPESADFLLEWLGPRLAGLRERLGADYPRVLVIFGNDDPRAQEAALVELAGRGLLEHAHARRLQLGPFSVYGYACVPPTPFHLKDWERYDVSRFVDPGCVSPEEGIRSVPVDPNDAKWGTIARDLETLVGEADVSRAAFLVHTPPYQTKLDRAALDGRRVDHVPLDPHIGSVAVRRFVEARQPLVTLHGHVHESARLTGSWQDRIGRTVCLSAAHDGPELALVRLDLEDPQSATRELL
jgi:Icc-related predicted phosphoesterase